MSCNLMAGKAHFLSNNWKYFSLDIAAGVLYYDCLTP